MRLICKLRTKPYCKFSYIKKECTFGFADRIHTTLPRKLAVLGPFYQAHTNAVLGDVIIPPRRSAVDDKFNQPQEFLHLPVVEALFMTKLERYITTK